MNFEEIKVLKDKLKVYNLKYDDDIFNELIANYDAKDVLDAWRKIIENRERITGINIISELKELLKNILPLVPQIHYQSESCKFCRGSGLVSFVDDIGYNYAVACKCYYGGIKGVGLTRWNGLLWQDIGTKKDVKQMQLHESYSYLLEEKNAI